MTVDSSKQCTITNNSGKDFLLTLAIPQDEIANNGGTIAANGKLEVLTTSDGNTIIKNNNSGTVTLDHSYKPGGDQTGYVKDYELVAGDTNWLYPLGTVDAVQTDSNDTTGFSSLTIDTNSATGLAQAAKFSQAISAYAESQLITDYTTALEATKNATTAEEIAATMNAFFKSTTDYKDVTLSDMSAIQGYYNNFPAVWAQYKDDLTYYLYGSDGTVNSFQGTVSLKKSGPLDPLKPAGGYTCTFTPAINPTDTSVYDVDSSKQATLNYSDGMFVTDKTAGQASVSLKGNFLLKSFFTNQETDDSILTVLSGNVNGIVCVGFDDPQPPANSTTTTATGGSGQDFWDSLIHPQSQLQIGISVAVFCGAVALLGGIVGAVYAIYKKVSATNSTPNVGEAIDGEITKANDTAKTLLGENAPPQKPYVIRDHLHAAQIMKDSLRRGQMIEAFERQKWAAKGILELAPEVLGSDAVTALQQILTDGRDSTAKLNQASLDDIREVINTELPKLEIMQGQLRTLQLSTADELSEKSGAELTKNLKTGDDLIKSVNDSIDYENKEEPETEFVYVEEPY